MGLQHSLLSVGGYFIKKSVYNVYRLVVFGCCVIVQGNTKCRLSGENGLVMIGSS